MLGGLSGAEVCRPLGFFSRRPHPRRRCLPWNNLQDHNHGEGPESSVTSAPRESKLLAFRTCVDFRRLGLEENGSTVRQRLFSPGPHSAVGALGKIRVQVLRSSGTFPGAGGPTGGRRFQTLVSWCFWPSVERAQPLSVPPKLHGLPQIPKELAGCHRGWSPGRSQGNVRTARRRISVMQSHVAKLLRQGKREQLGETDSEKAIVRAQSESEPETKPRPCRRDPSGLGRRRCDAAKKKFRHGGLESMRRDSQVTNNLTCKTQKTWKRSLKGAPTLLSALLDTRGTTGPSL